MYVVYQSKKKLSSFYNENAIVLYIILSYILNYFITNKILGNKDIYDIFMSIILSSFVAFITYYISEYFNRLKIWKKIERQEYANYALTAFICYLVKNKFIIKMSQGKMIEIKTLYREFKELKEKMRINVDEDSFKKYISLQRKSSLLAYELRDSFQERYMKNSIEIRYQL